MSDTPAIDDVIDQLRGLADEMVRADGERWRTMSAMFLRVAAEAVERQIASLQAELELERRKDHAYNAFRDGYERAQADYAAGRIQGWPSPESPH